MTAKQNQDKSEPAKAIWGHPDRLVGCVVRTLRGRTGKIIEAPVAADTVRVLSADGGAADYKLAALAFLADGSLGVWNGDEADSGTPPATEPEVAADGLFSRQFSAAEMEMLGIGLGTFQERLTKGDKTNKSRIAVLAAYLRTGERQ